MASFHYDVLGGHKGHRVSHGLRDSVVFLMDCFNLIVMFQHVLLFGTAIPTHWFIDGKHTSPDRGREGLRFVQRLRENGDGETIQN